MCVYAGTCSLSSVFLNLSEAQFLHCKMGTNEVLREVSTCDMLQHVVAITIVGGHNDTRCLPIPQK